MRALASKIASPRTSVREGSQFCFCALVFRRRFVCGRKKSCLSAGHELFLLYLCTDLCCSPRADLDLLLTYIYIVRRMAHSFFYMIDAVSGIGRNSADSAQAIFLPENLAVCNFCINTHTHTHTLHADANGRVNISFLLKYARAGSLIGKASCSCRSMPLPVGIVWPMACMP